MTTPTVPCKHRYMKKLLRKRLPYLPRKIVDNDVKPEKAADNCPHEPPISTALVCTLFSQPTSGTLPKLPPIKPPIIHLANKSARIQRSNSRTSLMGHQTRTAIPHKAHKALSWKTSGNPNAFRARNTTGSAVLQLVLRSWQKRKTGTL